MKAITLMQPWATLVAIGEKQFETRSWSTNYRGPLAIHAAKSIPKWVRALVENNTTFARALAPHGFYAHNLPTGVVVAVCRIKSTLRSEEARAKFRLSSQEMVFGNYSSRMWVWELTDVQPIEPVAAMGALGLWEWVDTRVSVDTEA